MRAIAIVTLVGFLVVCLISFPSTPSYSIEVTTLKDKLSSMEIGYGAIGMEFHHNLPAPSRISFYDPVANSMDVSHDYWTRDTSRVFFFTLHETKDGPALDTLGSRPFDCEWTPLHAYFNGTFGEMKTGVNYDMKLGFSRTVAMQARLKLQNTTLIPIDGYLTIHMNTAVRTCHSYNWRYPTEINQDLDTGTYNLDFIQLKYPYEDTDSTRVLLMVENLGRRPGSTAPWESEWDIISRDTGGDTDKKTKGLIRTDWRIVHGTDSSGIENQVVEGWLPIHLEPGDSVNYEYLLWAESMTPEKTDSSGTKTSTTNIIELSERYLYTCACPRPMPELYIDIPVYRPGASQSIDWTLQTQIWARKVFKATYHPFEQSHINMPCPAQYNFFFTHDVLVNDLGQVYSNTDSVKHDLNFIRKLTEPGATLVHARYFRDGEYVSEYCGADSWNHLWFILLTAKYLRHSGDVETVQKLLPIVDASVKAVLSQLGDDGLMHGSRPDWWDIGKVPGPKTYLTVLTCRALREYGGMLQKLERTNRNIAEHLNIADTLQANLPRLWDEDAEYLLNINEGEWDRHYFSGSLTSVWFDLLDSTLSGKLLATAERELLDPNLGIRNAMPHDFQGLEERYRYLEGEVGAPYKYFNGGVWSQGTAWYVLALIHQGRLDDAYNALSNNLTVDGVANSPGGQRSFYEYRYADPESELYGKVDKPTFLWMGGWFEHCLYELRGVRETPWHVRLVPDTPDIPEGRISDTFMLVVNGHPEQVTITGSGAAFTSLEADGHPVYAAVLFEQADSVRFVRGTPTAPYVEDLTGFLRQASWDAGEKQFIVACEGVTGRETQVTLVSPEPPKQVACEVYETEMATKQMAGGWYRSTISFTAGRQEAVFRILF